MRVIISVGFLILCVLLFLAASLFYLFCDVWRNLYFIVFLIILSDSLFVFLNALRALLPFLVDSGGILISCVLLFLSAVGLLIPCVSLFLFFKQWRRATCFVLSDSLLCLLILADSLFYLFYYSLRILCFMCFIISERFLILFVSLCMTGSLFYLFH